MRRRYLFAYDIRDDRRLRAVHQIAKAYGEPLQYSVFIGDLDRGERLGLEADLRDTMNLKEDSVVFVDLGEATGRGRDCFAFLGHRPFELPRSGAMIV